MQNSSVQAFVPAGAEACGLREAVERDCICVSALACKEPPPLEPYQLSFLSPLPQATTGGLSKSREEDPDYLHVMRRLRPRRVRCLTKADVEKSSSNEDERAPLRTSTGEVLPVLYVREETAEG